MEVLLTGFEPFLEHRENPSQILVEKMDHQHRLSPIRESLKLTTRVLPVDYEESWQQVLGLLEERESQGRGFQWVLCTGLAADRHCLSLEAGARNWMKWPDPAVVEGALGGKEILPGERGFLPSALPWTEALGRLQASGISAEISQDAGSYVCNFLTYRLLHHLDSSSAQAGFIHIPPFAALAPELSLKALEILLQLACEP